MAQRTLISAAGVLLIVLLVAAQALSQHKGKTQSCSVNPDSSLHWEAVFGHATSTWQATLMLRPLQRAGFKGIGMEKDACDDVELALTGLDTAAAREALAKKATVAHNFSFEPPDILKRPNPSLVKAVFGVRPTLSRASQLQLIIAHVGFREGSDIERLGLHSWRVVIYNIPVGSQADFAAEAARGGFTVTFLPQ